jgi:hypothetical protein
LCFCFYQCAFGGSFSHMGSTIRSSSCRGIPRSRACSKLLRVSLRSPALGIVFLFLPIVLTPFPWRFFLFRSCTRSLAFCEGHMRCSRFRRRLHAPEPCHLLQHWHFDVFLSCYALGLFVTGVCVSHDGHSRVCC